MRILFVEDLPTDAELAVMELRKEGLRFEHTRVDTRTEFIKALNDFRPDIVISDYMMPSYNGMQALKDAHEFDPSVPFILYTGSMNEETAVECLKAGADDYVIKEHMTRLPFAVKEALEQRMIQIEKRAAELLLRENEEKLQSIFRVAPVGIGLVVDRVFIEVNDTFCKMTGYDRKELIGKTSEMVYPTREEYEFVGLEKNRQIAEKGIASVETRLKCKDGRILNIITGSTPLDACDLSKGLTFTVLDITERKRAEEALRESEDRFHTLYNDAVVGLYRTNSQGEILLANRALVKMLGFQSFEELSARNVKKTGYGPSYQRQQFVDQIEKDGEVKNLEAIWICRDGKEIFVRENAKAICDSEGKILYYDGSVEDITERKRAEEALRESEEKYRRIFENVQDLYYETSIEGTIIEISPSIEILSKGQYHRNELIGKSIFDFYSDPKERQALLAVLQERGAVTDFEITLKNCDGSHIPCSISSKICFDAQGRPEKIIGSMHDITDRKNVSDALKLAKEKAEASDKLKTTFLNNISHEVRTPLNGILGFAEIMSQTDLPEEDKQLSLSMLFESSDRLLNTITNYMDISLITSGNMSINKKDFIPGLVLRKIFDNYKTICSSRKLELSLKIPEQTDNLSVNSDPEIFQKIISHLLNNAIKFTEKGSINYGYIIHKGELDFFVKDTGIGIGKESIDNIFDHFVKEDRGPSELTEGSGLGLSIAKGMIEIIGGTIRVESEMGVGSCFFFTIPLK